MTYSVLIVDDEPDQAETIHRFLENERAARAAFDDIDSIDVAHDAYAVREQLSAVLPSRPESLPWRLIIADVFMPPAGAADAAASPDHGGLMLYDCLADLRSGLTDTKVLRRFPKLVLTSNRPGDLGDAALRITQEQQELAAHRGQWAFYIPKPRMPGASEAHGRLMKPWLWNDAIIAAVQQVAAEDWLGSLMSGSIADLLGTSSDIVGIKVDMVERLVHNRLVCLAGESGTGKELVARALHDLGGKGQLQFDNLQIRAEAGNFESMFFGYTAKWMGESEGAYEGMVGPAENGTIWLDEANVSAMARVEGQLRRFLEHGEWKRIGEDVPHVFEGRVILSSSDMQEYFNEYARPDFRSRAGNQVVTLPPLRHHPEDIPALAERFFERSVRERFLRQRRTNDKTPSLAPELLEYLQTLEWRNGNVRELANCMKMIADRCHGLAAGSDLLEDSPWNASVRELPTSFTTTDGLRSLLTRHNGVRDAAAREAGVHRTTLSRWIRDHGLADEFPSKPGPRRSKRRND